MSFRATNRAIQFLRERAFLPSSGTSSRKSSSAQAATSEARDLPNADAAGRCPKTKGFSRQHILRLSAGALLVGIFLAPSFFHHQDIAFVQGKPLRFWITQIDNSGSASDRKSQATVLALGERAVPVLIRALQTRDSRFQQIWQQTARKLSLTRIQFVNRARLRAGAAIALQKLGSSAEPAIPVLIESLNDPEQFVAARAEEALVKFNPNSLPGLTDALFDSAKGIRARAASALGKMEGAAIGSVPTLIMVLPDPEAEVRLHAVQALGEIGAKPEMAMPALIPRLQDESGLVRERTAAILCSFGAAAAPAAPALTDALMDSQDSVRVYAANALGKIGSLATNAVPQLTKLLTASAPMVRSSAALALGRIGREANSAAPALLLGLKDPDRLMRGYCAEALGKIGGEPTQAIPALVAMLRDEYFTARACAAEALGRYGTLARSAVPSLLNELYNDQSGLGRQIRVSLKKITPEITYYFTEE